MFKLPVRLTYCPEGFAEIQKFLEQNCHKDYTLSIYDETTGRTQVMISLGILQTHRSGR